MSDFKKILKKFNYYINKAKGYDNNLHLYIDSIKLTNGSYISSYRFENDPSPPERSVQGSFYSLGGKLIFLIKVEEHDGDDWKEILNNKFVFKNSDPEINYQKYVKLKDDFMKKDREIKKNVERENRKRDLDDLNKLW